MTLHDRAQQLVSDLESLTIDSMFVSHGDNYFSPDNLTATLASVQRVLSKVIELAHLVEDLTEASGGVNHRTIGRYIEHAHEED